MKLSFKKYHGLGNDFVILDGRAETPALDPEQVLTLCDRHRGIGADGVLILEKGQQTPFRMVLYNADGSPAEVSGNGLRCFALFLRDIGEDVSGSIHIETGLDISEVEIVQDTLVRVQMPRPNFNIEPTMKPGTKRLHVAGQSFDALILSVGNPHCVVFGPLRDEIFVRTYGPLIEKDKSFPAGTNVEFGYITSRNSCQLTVWERGAGLTLACGSGAAATVCAGAALGKLQSGAPVTITQAGGDLQIIVTPDLSQVTLEGTAEFVFSGEIII
jgi:diaminopimelate epimerase